MYRLLIVDDEEIIVNGLFEIFRGLPSLALDIYKAYSGQEALDWLIRTRMDIVLTDINMPGISGLELLEHIHSRWPRCHVILLTGHEEFQYVYEAIKHPNVSYILKTEDPDQVIKALKDAVRQIESEVKTEDLVRQAKEQIEKAQLLFQNDYLINLLRDDSFEVDPGLLAQLGIPLKTDKKIVMMIGQVNNLGRLTQYTERLEALNAFRLLVTRYLGLQVRHACVLDERQNHIWLFQVADSEDETQPPFLHTYLAGTLESIQAVYEEKFGMSASFAVSKEPVPWQMLSDEYDQLNQMLDSRSGIYGEILYGSRGAEAEESKGISDNMLWKAEEDAQGVEAELRKRRTSFTRYLLETGDSERFFDAVEPLLKSLAKVRSMHSYLATEAYFHVSMAYLNYINRWQLVEKMAFQISLANLSKPTAFKCWADAAEYLRQVGRLLFCIRNESEYERVNITISTIHDFVRESLHEDLSLVRLAELVHLNPSYLSRLYKNTTGNNLSDFIDAARLQRAKTLLEQDSIKVMEVAQQVGYDSAASFSRFFKKASGFSPQEYKDQVKNRKA